MRLCSDTNGLSQAGLGIQTWLCDPQAFGQKGTVENTNRRARRWLPRDTDPLSIDDQDLHQVCKEFRKSQAANATGRFAMSSTGEAINETNIVTHPDGTGSGTGTASFTARTDLPSNGRTERSSGTVMASFIEMTARPSSGRTEANVGIATGDFIVRMAPQSRGQTGRSNGTVAACFTARTALPSRKRTGISPGTVMASFTATMDPPLSG